ncbi:T9SS type A sorting domain-containing protein [Psychroserpens sp. AS72]|uniref:T9SS type A sorting domain-containing protein n=1 Tax=Psychroserpens sp. AS72 TaxID=3135775 RepID=UPI00317AC5F8
MKKLYFLCLTLLVTSLSFGQDLVITAAFDGPLPGGLPKGIELYVINDIDDLSNYGIGSANNGGGTDGEEFTFPADAVTAGTYLLIGSEDVEFPNWFGSAPDYNAGSAMGINGDDAVELYQNGVVIDTFGDINVDGNGTPWEYLDGWAYRVDGTGPDGSTFVLGNWFFSGANALDGETSNGAAASPIPVGTYTTVANTDPTITITSPSNATDFAPGTMSVDVEFSTTNLVGGETVDITVNGNTTNNVSSPFTVITVDGQTYNVTVELVDGGVIDSDMVSFSVLSSNNVANIAALRAGTIGEVYTLTGEAFLTYQQNFRNQKYIEDASGAILIDDSSGTISSMYAIGDGISGISGTLGEFSGTFQFVPVADPGAATSTGNTLTPQTVTLAMLTANSEQYESELVEVIAVTMDNTEPVFMTGTAYALTQGGDNFNFRTSFFDADYIGANVPTTATDIVGILNERADGYFITARDADDFSVQILSVDEFGSNAFSMYPNPTSTGFVNVVGTNDNAISVSVYDVLGKQVINQTLTNNRIDVSALNAGLYIVKISQNDASVTKKLVIK